MDRSNLWQQEQVQHRDDTESYGEQEGDGGQSGDSGDYGYGGADDYSGSGDAGSGGDDTANSGYQAVCDDHGPGWHGPCRPDYDTAFNDANAHNDSAHKGQQLAGVFGPGPCF